MRKPNVVLIGMPGAGKSTVGVLLAKALGLSFVDTDLLLQEREGRLLQEVIDVEGVDEFLRREEAVILGLEARGAVIATGGSAIYGPAAMARLRRAGTVVYLQVALAEIERRVRNMGNRGIAVERGRTLADLYAERVPLYEKFADLTFDCSGCGVEETVTRVAEAIRRE
jgi:shikimate kinase